MRPTLFLFAGLLLIGCGSARKQLERAQVYETNGMLQEAFAGYRALYEDRPKTVEAHVGMGRTAQALLNAKLMDATARFVAGDLLVGERLRDEAQAWKRRMSLEGLELKWDVQADIARNEARALAARALSERAGTAFRSDRFAEAEALAAEALTLQADHKEAEYLRRLAQLEPRYREGLRAEELGLWREAHKAYTWITDQDIGYKDAWSRLSTVRQKATYTLAIVPLHNSELYPSKLGGIGGQVEVQLVAKIEQAILDLQEPTIALVDRTNTDQLLAEQQRSMEGVYDERYAVSAGRLMGAAHVLSPRILRFDDVLSRMIEVQVQVLDAETGRIELARIVSVGKAELEPGNTRAQLLALAANKVAALIGSFEPRDQGSDH